MTIELDGPGVTLDDVVAVARRDEPVVLTSEATRRMASTRAIVERLAGGPPAYGVSTGFGALATVTIPPDRRAALQAALVRSHAAGVGAPVEREVVRAMMFLRARTLALGYSGNRPLVADALVTLLNRGITPVVPEHGSLGASGDLAPLAHCALALLGEGEVDVDGHLVAARNVVEPITLGEKEGLALTNGTDGILGMLCLACVDVAGLLRAADVIAAMTVEGLLATDRAYAADLMALRPHPGQAASASNLRRCLDGSAIVASHRTGDVRVQDAYSIRCTPQVHGAARDTLAFACAVADRELAAAIDNPTVLPDGRIESCGNFHGAPLGHACDFLAIVLADVGAIAERRIDRLMDAHRSAGLPPFLADDPGVDSGLMIAHYSAAGLCADSKRLAAPASVDTIPTSAMQEDHVSMAWSAARKLRTVLRNTVDILAIEYVAAARAVDLRAPLEPARATAAARTVLRDAVPGPGPDHFVAPDLAAAAARLRSGALLGAVEAVTGPLD